MQRSIGQFTLSLLAYKGALVEEDGGGAGALLGAELASTPGMSEYQRLVFDPGLDPGDALRVDYDSPAFERIARLVDAMGGLASVRAQLPPLKAIDAEAELDRALSLRNGIYRFQQCVPVTRTYFCFFVDYEAMADERAGGVVEIWVNPVTRSVPSLAAVVDSVEMRDEPPGEDIGALAAGAWDLAQPSASAAIRVRLREFAESLKRRRERDLRRVRDYYHAIDGEIRRKIARPSLKAEARRTEVHRLEATGAAYRSRAAELLERYRVRVRVARLGALACALPAYEIQVQLMRRSAKREVAFSWNPVDRRIEPRCCDACRHPVGAAAFCDDRVHYLCPDCLGPCPQCSKPYCRACYKRCPRNHPQ
jgi:hypothetical protein